MDVAGNCTADEVDGEASRKCAQEEVPIELKTAKAAVHREMQQQWRREADAGISADHTWRRATAKGMPKYREIRLPRAACRTLAQLRSG